MGYPTTAAALHTLVGGTWTQGWLCDVASGSLTASFGTTLTASGTGTALTYGVTGPLGGADKAINFTYGSSRGFNSGGTALNVTATQDLIAAAVFRLPTPSAIGDEAALIYKDPTGNEPMEFYVQSNDGVTWDLSFYRNDSGGGGGFQITLNAVPIGVWIFALACHDQGAGEFALGYTTDGVTQVSDSVSRTPPLGNWAASSTSNTVSVGGFSAFGGDGGHDIAAVYAGTGAGAASGMASGITTGGATLAFYNGIMGGAVSDDAFARPEMLRIAATPPQQRLRYFDEYPRFHDLRGLPFAQNPDGYGMGDARSHKGMGVLRDRDYFFVKGTHPPVIEDGFVLRPRDSMNYAQAAPKRIPNYGDDPMDFSQFTLGVMVVNPVTPFGSSPQAGFDITTLVGSQTNGVIELQVSGSYTGGSGIAAIVTSVHFDFGFPVGADGWTSAMAWTQVGNAWFAQIDAANVTTNFSGFSTTIVITTVNDVLSVGSVITVSNSFSAGSHTDQAPSPLSTATITITT